MPGMSDNHQRGETSSTSGDDWDAYWAHGFLTSCANAFAGNYDGQIRAAWHAFFATLNKGDRILDIATGNGAVALLAAEYSREHEQCFHVDAIDRARINPAGAWQGAPEILAAVSFHGQVAAEKTPFDPASFQAVTGQYALEYTDCDATIDELARIMTPGAQARFIMHHPDSVVVSTSREEQAHGRLLFCETDIFSKSRALLQRICAAGSPEARRAMAGSPEAEAERSALNGAAAAVSAAIETSDEPELLSTALGHIGEAFRLGQAGDPTEALASLDRGEAEILANLARLEDLLGAVVDETRMTAIRAHMATAGIATCNPSPLFFTLENKELLMGWQLDCRRNA